MKIKSEYKTGYLYFYVFVIALGGFNVGNSFLSTSIGYNLTVFNTLVDVLGKTFDWDANTKRITSVPKNR